MASEEWWAALAVIAVALKLRPGCSQDPTAHESVMRRRRRPVGTPCSTALLSITLLGGDWSRRVEGVRIVTRRAQHTIEASAP
jgi:hypothetical protein